MIPNTRTYKKLSVMPCTIQQLHHTTQHIQLLMQLTMRQMKSISETSSVRLTWDTGKSATGSTCLLPTNKSQQLMTSAYFVRENTKKEEGTAYAWLDVKVAILRQVPVSGKHSHVRGAVNSN